MPSDSRNERGPIAESYDQLQSLPEIRAARASYPLPPASADSLTRTLLQGAEIALLNMAELLDGCVRLLETQSAASAAARMAWAGGFNRLLVTIALTVEQAAPLLTGGDPSATLTIRQSPALRHLRRVLRRLESQALLFPGIDGIRVVLASEFQDSPEFQFLQRFRMWAHECGIWERRLSRVPLWHTPSAYQDVIGYENLRKAVCGFELRGETFLRQFRALHQIPELFALEAADHAAASLRCARAGDPLRATAYASCAAGLAEAMAACVQPLAENLSTSDYHKIRENLGLTSGSHSTALRYSLFQDYYEALSEAVRRLSGADVADRLLRAAVLRFRSAIRLWRDLHMHLPRNNLGASGTRSLIGAPDALTSVKQMASASTIRDPLAAEDVRVSNRGEPGLLEQFLSSPESLDSVILRITGEITRQRFPAVQDRSGYFSGRPKFSPPPPSKV